MAASSAFIIAFICLFQMNAHDCQLFNKFHIKRDVCVTLHDFFLSGTNNDLLLTFINDVVAPADRLFNLTVVQRTDNVTRTYEKGIPNIRGHTHNGTKIYLEILLKAKKSYKERNMRKWGETFKKNFPLIYMNENQTYAKVVIIDLVILGCSLKTPGYHHVMPLPENIRIKKKYMLQPTEKLYDELVIHILDLEKFCLVGKCETLDELTPIVKTRLDAWVALLTRHHLLFDYFDRGNVTEPYDYDFLLKGVEILRRLKKEKLFYL